MRSLGLSLLLICCSGCYSQVTNLDSYISEEELHRFPTVDKVLTSFFSEEAYEILKDIPTVDGISTSAYASGTSRWSSIGSWITGSGVGRKVIISKRSLLKNGYALLVHEYVHHLDDLTRDNPENHKWINIEVFLQAYEMLSKDFRYKGIQSWCEKRANDWFTNTFGIGRASEHIAYIAMFLVGNNRKTEQPNKAPDYLKAVFGNMLNIPYREESYYTTVGGERYLVRASPNGIELYPRQ